MLRRSFLIPLWVVSFACSGTSGISVTPDAGAITDLPTEGTATNDVALEVRPDGGYADACQAVANSTFLSTEEHECGLTPTGVASCQWSIAFTDNGATRTLSWRLSDYSMTMSYTCSGFTLTASAVGGPTYTGTYDPATGILLWDGFNYTKVNR